MRAVSEEALARWAAEGDQGAFSELAWRYRGLIRLMTRWPGPGAEREDLRQAALLGLWDACGAFDRRSGALSPLARVCMRRRVWTARSGARRGKHRVLTDALGLDQRGGSDGDGEELTIAERLPARDGFDPARVIAARETLAELRVALKALTPAYREALESEANGTAQRRYHARRRLQKLLDQGPAAAEALRDGRKFSDDQKRRAVALVAAGSDADRGRRSGWRRQQHGVALDSEGGMTALTPELLQGWSSAPAARTSRL